MSPIQLGSVLGSLLLVALSAASDPRVQPGAACLPADDEPVALVQTVVARKKANASNRTSEDSLSLTQEGTEGTTATTTPDPTGLSLNGKGDFPAFLSALEVNIFTVLGCFAAFSFLRLRYPKVYSNNFSVTKDYPEALNPSTYLGWIKAAWNVKPPQTMGAVGLDAAMMIEFCNLGMQICGIIGVPMVCLAGSMNWWFGGHIAESRLSVLGFNNIEESSPLYWVHAFIVWAVAIVVRQRVFKAQSNFMGLRFLWLQLMDETRANTIMVENIPEGYRSDEKLKDLFEGTLPGDQVADAYCVKDTTKLHALKQEIDAAKVQKNLYESMWEKEGKDPNKKPLVSPTFFSSKVDAIEYYSNIIENREPLFDKERKRVLTAADKEEGGVNMSTGFVKFKERQHANIALQFRMSSDSEEWLLRIPPEPEDVLWGDLIQDDGAKSGRHFLGYALVVGLIFAYMPLVLGMTNLAEAVDLGFLQSIWAGIAPTLGLTVMVSFLPTFLLMIFRSFFTLYADRWAQEKLHNWYFWFQILFVVLAPAIGDDFMSFASAVSKQPFRFFNIAANKLPLATHFFLNYMVLQWATHSMNLLRYMNLAKFKTYCQFFSDEEEARKHAEPEDQDYYGIGGRSGRWAINLTIGLVYGQLSPLLLILTFINFAVSRLIYSHLLCFAESKKGDMGGVFWVQKLKQTLTGAVIYSIVITGVLLQRGANLGPGIIAAPSIVYLLWARNRFDSAFDWEKLSFMELMGKSKIIKPYGFEHLKPCESTGEYVQPELA